MTRWLISVPVWGDHNRRVFAERAAPALREALRLFDHDVRFLVYTDEPEFIRGVLGGFEVKIVAIRPDVGYTGLQDAHMDGIRTAAPGERVAFLTADLVVSPNLFTACEARLAAGKRLVMMAGTRTDIACGPPPLVTTCRDLLAWAWAHRHQIIRDVEWGLGASSAPTTLYFSRGTQVVMHGFHLSPIAMVKGAQEISFDTTVDNELADYFDLDDIHVVQSPDEACTLEISASERRFPVRYEPMDEEHVARTMRTRTSRRHRELFLRRIVICDDDSDDPWEMPIIENILTMLEKEPIIENPPILLEEEKSRALTRWLIAVPVWGEFYVDQFCAMTLPALQCAVSALQKVRDIDVRLIVYTDSPDRVLGVASVRTDVRPVPAGARTFDCMSQAHREVLALGRHGDVVILLTAGAVLSEQSLAYCAEVLENPNLRAVLCAVPRVLADEPIPDTSDAQTLMDWAWEHRHLITKECTWPDGRSTDLSRTYFVAGDVVVTRVFLPHPLAIRLDGRQLQFTPTIDANLIHCFDKSEMHVTTDCRMLTMFKLTPADKEFQLHEATMAERAAGGGMVVTDQLQRWCAAHRIFLRGSGAADCTDGMFMESVRGGRE